MAGKILVLIVTICVFGFLLWTVQWYIELPTVKFSVSHQKVVAVENVKEEALPLSPLPQKYEKLYVE